MRYRLGPARRLANAAIDRLLRLGVPIPHTYLLTTRGRRTGRLRSTPVYLIEEGGERWLVAPYGVVGWVHNARAAGTVTLSRGRSSEQLRVTELGPEAGAPVLRSYLRQVPVVWPYFDARPNASLQELASEVPHHPVFRLEPA